MAGGSEKGRMGVRHEREGWGALEGLQRNRAQLVFN